MRNRRIAALGLVLAATLAGTGCSVTLASSNGNGVQAGEGWMHLFPPADRKQVPDLSGSLLGGGQFRLSRYDGKVVVLNVWASWCPPCISEIDQIVDSARGNPQANFIGIDIRDEPSNAEAFVRAHRVFYPNVNDQAGGVILQLRDAVIVPSPPFTIVLDRKHRVAAEILGATTATTITEIIRPLIHASPATPLGGLSGR